MFGKNDITMCLAENCPKKDSCYRHTAKPEPIQSYSNFEELCLKDEGFDYFLEED